MKERPVEMPLITVRFVGQFSMATRKIEILLRDVGGVESSTYKPRPKESQ